MREPAWNKPISICSFSHAAILNVWSSHCPLAIDPRQRRTRNHQPVPTLTRKDDAGAGIMLQSRMRSAALLVLAAGMAATSATAKPPGAPPAGHPAPAPHPAAAPRAAPAPHAAPAARPAAPHIAAPRGAPQAPRAATPPAPDRARTGRRRATRAGRTWAEGADGRRSDARETGGRSRRAISCPARVGRTSGTTAPTVRATAGRAAAGSIRS